MQVELITTGSELLLGHILNTHVYWLGRRLAEMDLPLSRHITVPDTSEGIQAAVRDCLTRADLVITTGGLGPTRDDVTRDRIAELLGRKLIHQPEIERVIRQFFASRGRLMPDRTRAEAFIPEGATVLPNLHGTAPGLAFDVSPNPWSASGRRSCLVLLPGPPRELHPMFDGSVRDWLSDRLPRATAFVSQTYKTTGLGESAMEERLEKPLEHLLSHGLEVGYCARVGEVDIRFTAQGPGAAELVRRAGEILQAEAGQFVFGTGDDSVELCVLRELRARGWTLALAESCTGGHLANRLTNLPGASAVLLAGYVTYSNEAKKRSLGVPDELLRQYGAVSEAVARAMAEGARQAAAADYAISTTGIAGPDGGTPEKPVGTVFVGVAGPTGTEVVRHLNRFDRETFKFITAQQAFDQLRRRLSSDPARPPAV